MAAHQCCQRAAGGNTAPRITWTCAGAPCRCLSSAAHMAVQMAAHMAVQAAVQAVLCVPHPTCLWLQTPGPPHCLAAYRSTAVHSPPCLLCTDQYPDPCPIWGSSPRQSPGVSCGQPGRRSCCSWVWSWDSSRRAVTPCGVRPALSRPPWTPHCPWFQSWMRLWHKSVPTALLQPGAWTILGSPPKSSTCRRAEPGRSRQRRRTAPPCPPSHVPAAARESRRSQVQLRNQK
mmetsp:Transcript_33803/g.74929  ORF Transcript_33803/g.74929 Transcript_33803/m.74929 type:complete len:231 (+) Transcript_33803:530-1222(+)